MTTMDSNLQGIKNVALFHLGTLTWNQHVEHNRTSYRGDCTIAEVKFVYVLSYTNKTGASLSCTIYGVRKIDTGKKDISGRAVMRHEQHIIRDIPLLDKEAGKALYLKIHEDHLEKEATMLLNLMQGSGK